MKQRYFMQRKAFQAAFPYTVPVLTGFLVLGIAFGILMNSKGYGSFWPPFVSLIVYAGSMQFVAVGLLAAGLDLPSLLLMTLMVNARHMFYGISLLEQFRQTGWMKPYLIFGLCDETYSILCTTQPPIDVDRRWFMLFVTLLNQSYWVLGSAIGSFLGGLITFSTTGIDFALTALFVVIFISQWQSARDHGPALIGLGCALVCRLGLGPDRFLIPTLLLILFLVTLLRSKLERRQEHE